MRPRVASVFGIVAEILVDVEDVGYEYDVVPVMMILENDEGIISHDIKKFCASTLFSRTTLVLDRVIAGGSAGQALELPEFFSYSLTVPALPPPFLITIQ